MCGINGIMAINGRGEYSSQVVAMNKALAHRGPDDEGLFNAAGISLGHRRLSIIDLSAAGHQPMTITHLGRTATLVYNGEIYNFREVRRQLEAEGFVFHTQTDSEVILNAWFCWGEKSLHKLNGMFAFAIWDQQQQELLLVRDRLGIKPLYWSNVNGQIIFSSEIRGMLASGEVGRKIDPASLEDFLRYQTVHAPATILSGVSMLQAGHLVRAGSGKNISVSQWWKPVVTPQRHTTEQAKAEVLGLLRDAVEQRLVADVPFGAFLSGGIDSSAIVALMAEVSSQTVKTFSVSFDDSEFDEAKYARLVAAKYKTDHHEIRLRPDDFLHDIPAALKAMDHPSGDGPNTYVVSKATKQAGITMALSGLGGDELFAGYDIFKRSLSLEKNALLKLSPAFLRRTGAGLLKTMRPGIRSEKTAAVLALHKISFGNYYPLSRRVLLDEPLKEILGHAPESADVVAQLAQDAFDATDDEHRLSRVSLAEISTYMQHVLLRDSDQMSMAHALELRVPFMDYRLVEYVLGLSDAVKFPSSPKKLLVDALGDRLPKEIVNRPKMGFTFPWKHWLKNELRGFCEERLQRLASRNLLHGATVMKLWNAFLNNDPNVTWSRIWLLVVLENWIEENGIDA